MNTKLIGMINEALGLVYETTHPMKQVAISRILSEIKTELSKELNPTEFTKEARKYMECSPDPHWTDLAAYMTRACTIIERLQSEKPVCPDCCDSDLSMFVGIETFGGPGIFIPIHRCNKCDFQWTDDIGGEVWDKNRVLLDVQQSEKRKLTETLLRIDNYCRVNDIDLDRAMEG